DDPTITVTSTGVVYAVWMNEYTIVFAKSSDHGATWSAPKLVSGKISSDKPWIGISKNGTDVYITFTKGTGGDLYETHSHNGGSTLLTPPAVGTPPGTPHALSHRISVSPERSARQPACRLLQT